METLLTFLLAGAITLFFVRGYLKKLTGSKHSRTESSARKELRPCPRCGKSMEKGTAFCPHCGAAMAMWTVHLTSEQKSSTSAAPTGRAKPLINASLCIGCGSCVHECPETGTLELSGGKAILAHPERCTGHAKCAEVCPTQAITLSYDGVLQTMRVPMVKENFETNIPGVFIVGELCGMGLIKTAINEGKLVIDHLRRRMQQDTVVPSVPQSTVPHIRPSLADVGARSEATVGVPHPSLSGEGGRDRGSSTPSDFHDVAIIGAGPAGLSASLTAHQYGIKYVTFEQGEIASTIRQYPRQKFLMAEPLEIPLYGALYVGDGSKEALLSVWETIIHNTGVEIRTNEKVESIQKIDGGFCVVTPRGSYKARYVVLAMGKRGSPRRLNVEGEDLAKVSYRLIEADTYEEKDLLVVGGGDSAIEAALALSRSGRNRVTLCHRGDSFARARERNRGQLDKAGNEGRIRILLHTHVERIAATFVMLTSQHDAARAAGNPGSAAAPSEGRGDQYTFLPNDYTFILIGGESPEDFLRKVGIEIVEKALGPQYIPGEPVPA